MKNFILLVFLILAVKVYSVDYSYCQKVITFPGNSSNFPFLIDDNGVIKPHATVNMVVDNETRTTTITVPSAYEGYPDQTIIFKRDSNNLISQIQSSSSFRARPTSSGLGSRPAGVGMLGMNPMMGGFGGPMMNSDMTTITDIKMVNGKCFPYRSVSASKTNNHTHRMFTYDVQLCRDINDFNKKVEDSTSRLSQLKSCYDEYIKESEQVIRNHKSRNNELYNPPKDENDYYGGIFEGEGDFSAGTAGGQGGWGAYGGMGGFGMSIDMIVNNEGLNGSDKLKMLTQYCSFGIVAEMAADDSLFPVITGGEAEDASSKALIQ